MINRCIGCYYHDIKENVCTHGSPIFIDDVCTDYQDSEFAMQIRADAIEELKDKKDEIIRWLIKRDKEGYGTTNGELLDHILEIAEQLKSQLPKA